MEKLYEEQANVPYNFNILDEQEGHIVENSHTNILMKILQYKNKYQNRYIFLENFFNYLNIPISLDDSNPVIFKRERISKGNQKKGRIDGFIYQENNFALIIENKVNHAGPTEQQIQKYIEGILSDNRIKDINGEAGINKIMIIYLTEDGIDKPQKTDVEYLISIGICFEESREDDYAEIQGERYFAVNYQYHILPWLKEEIQPIVMQREQVLNTGLLQYINYLEGMFGQRQQELDMMDKCKEVFENLDEIKELQDYTIANRNQKLRIVLSALKKVKKNDDDESERKYYVANILKNLIEKKNEELLKLFIDITRNYFKSKGMKECVIHPVFNFYYIQIRDAAWPRCIHFEWYPLGINRLTGNKDNYTLCFHVESKTETNREFLKLEPQFINKGFEKKQQGKNNRTLSYIKKINKSNKPILEMSDEELNKFLEDAYSGITNELINSINEKVKQCSHL